MLVGIEGLKDVRDVGSVKGADVFQFWRGWHTAEAIVKGLGPASLCLQPCPFPILGDEAAVAERNVRHYTRVGVGRCRIEIQKILRIGAVFGLCFLDERTERWNAAKQRAFSG